MSITDELRAWAFNELSYKTRFDALTAIADRIDAEHERKVAEVASGWDYWESTHVELPKDADGESIHIGDVLQWPEDGDTFEVIGIGDDGVLFYFGPDTEGETADWTSSQNKRHYHKPTVEDILHQFLGECDSAINLGYDEVPHEVFAKYASKLRLADDEKEQ